MTVPYTGVPIFNPDGTFRKEDDVVQGRSFSSNLTKMLKHMDKLEAIQQGKPPSPVMAHISLTNACNLTCSFCCFANRDISEKMPTEMVLKALDSFREIGVTGVEFTGGGEPSIHPDFKKIVHSDAPNLEAPDPRWAGELSKLKDLLANQKTPA